MKKYHLRSFLSPGDALTLTVAVASLHKQYPDEYLTSVQTSAMEIWENNPFVTKFTDQDEVETIDIHYPTIQQCNQLLVPFLYGYTSYLSQVIERPITPCSNIPLLYISDEEKQWMDQVQQYVTFGKKVPFWLIVSGTKRDYTCKQWPIEYYQEVVSRTAGMIQWVQVGANEHGHHPIAGAIDLRGKTNHRELIRLVYHSQGGLGPVTYLQHLCAAFNKPYLCLLGGREPVAWTTYPKQQTFHTIGQLPCCQDKACWISRVVPLPDNDEEKNKSLCENPCMGFMKPVGKCMAMIKPGEIINVLKRYGV